MINPEELKAIAKKRVEEKEKSSAYEPLRKKLNQLQDFRANKNELTIQNTNSKSENEFDFNKVLSELR